jgi:hypothetical protein
VLRARLRAVSRLPNQSMTALDFDQATARWNSLRGQLHKASATKAHTDVVRLCDEILAFSAGNPAISVVDWMFEKRASKALAGCGLFREAIARMDRAIAGCKRFRATARLATPDDFLPDVGTMETLRDRWRRKADGSQAP